MSANNSQTKTPAMNSENSDQKATKTPNSEPLVNKSNNSTKPETTAKNVNNSEVKVNSDKNIENEVQKYYNRDVWHVTTSSAKTKIESRVKQLEKMSAEILQNPDSAHEEKEAHKYLCAVLNKLDCTVHSSYIHPTAFKAIFSSGPAAEHTGAPTVGLICEYDAIPGFGHCRGNNLVSEATIGTLLGLREAMKADTRLVGKLVILGTPASEESGGKIRMMKGGAFDKIDVIVAIRPSNHNCLLPKFYCSQKIRVYFTGTARHMDSSNVIHGRNPVDAAVLCYTNSMSLASQLQPDCQIHCIIKRCGDIDYLVPKRSEMVFCVRAPTFKDLDHINRRIVDCGESAAHATQTRVEFHFPDDDMYSYVNHNKVLANIFKEEALKLGVDFQTVSYDHSHPTTDLGNVSHKVPLICPSFAISTDSVSPVHTPEFAAAVSRAEAQSNTIRVSVIMSLTIIKYLLNANIRQEIRKQFEADIEVMTKSVKKD